MPNISSHPTNQPPVRPFTASPSQPPAPTPSVVPPRALEALLQSGPSSSRSPKRPYDAKPAPSDLKAMERELNHLGTHIDGRAIERMFREPDAQTSQSLLKQIKTLLTPENIRNLMGSEHAKTGTEHLGKLESQFSKHAIAPVLSSIGAEHMATYSRQSDWKRLDSLLKMLTGSTDDFLTLFQSLTTQQIQLHKHATGCLEELSAREKTCEAIAAVLRKAIESGQHSDRPETHEANRPNIYRYAHTGESSLDSPSEIRHFVSGRDKLDVSGIHQQIDRPLQWVNHLSGAPGEMQVHYSQANNASVLVISGNKGEPPFVAKIFGKLKESDLVT